MIFSSLLVAIGVTYPSHKCHFLICISALATHFPLHALAMDNCTINRDVPFVNRDVSSDTSWWYTNCSDEINGTTIYYNITSSLLASCDCAAGFGANPDISGPGVGETVPIHAYYAE